MRSTIHVLVAMNLRAAVPATVQPFAGIDRYVHERGLNWELTIEPGPPRASASATPRFRGVIGRITPRVARFARAARIPVVNIWKSSPVSSLPSVVPDFEAAGRLAAEFLFGRGFRRVVFLGTNLPFSKPLGQGFGRAAEKLGMQQWVAFTEKWFFDQNALTFDAFIKRTQRLVDSLRPPVGIFGFDDFACRYIVQACEKRGLSVPGDVGIIGLTNNTLACTHPPPSLTSIDLNLELVGYRAAEMLDAIMARRTPPSEPVLVPPWAVVARRSTDHFVSDDETVAAALQFIASRLSSALRTSDIARHVAVSERTLQRRFAETVGHSVALEITLQRIRRAKQLLADTDKLIKQIAGECGFRDSQQFCRTFMRLEGVSATAYRDRYRT